MWGPVLCTLERLRLRMKRRCSLKYYVRIHTHIHTLQQTVACQRYLSGVNEGTINVMYNYLSTADSGAGGAGVADLDSSHTLGDASTDGGSQSLSLEYDMDLLSGGEGDLSNDERDGGGGAAPVVGRR